MQRRSERCCKLATPGHDEYRSITYFSTPEVASPAWGDKWTLTFDLALYGFSLWTPNPILQRQHVTNSVSVPAYTPNKALQTLLVLFAMEQNVSTLRYGHFLYNDSRRGCSANNGATRNITVARRSAKQGHKCHVAGTALLSKQFPQQRLGFKQPNLVILG